MASSLMIFPLGPSKTAQLSFPGGVPEAADIEVLIEFLTVSLKTLRSTTQTETER